MLSDSCWTNTSRSLKDSDQMDLDFGTLTLPAICNESLRPKRSEAMKEEDLAAIFSAAASARPGGRRLNLLSVCDSLLVLCMCMAVYGVWFVCVRFVGFWVFDSAKKRAWPTH